jgi:hypothetical protein
MNSLFYNYVFQEKPAPVVEENPEEETTPDTTEEEEAPPAENEENETAPPLEPQVDVKPENMYTIPVENVNGQDQQNPIQGKKVVPTNPSGPQGY